METLYEKPCLHISLDKEKQILFVVWKGFTPTRDFREGIDKISELMVQYNIKKTLTDLVEHRVIGAEDQEYAAKRSVDFSQQYWQVKRALITPKDVFARFSVKQVNSKVAQETPQDRQLFLTQEDALAWLEGDE